MAKKIQSRRRRLLMTVSALALTGSIYAGGNAFAENADRPPLWIDLGWHYEQMSGPGDVFHPAFVDALPADGFESPLTLEKRLAMGYGADASITFQPEGNDWLFSAAVRYGRSHGHANTHQETNPGSAYALASAPALGIVRRQTGTVLGARFAETSASNSETHLIADFQVGKDVGLGASIDSNLEFGVRFAQFNTRFGASLAADPDFHFVTIQFTRTASFGKIYFKSHDKQYFHNYSGSADFLRTFKGLGPSISWKASVPLAGNLDNGELTLDLGVNGAALFGRQKTSGKHQAKGEYHSPALFYGTVLYDHQTVVPLRSRSVVVPNIGGVAGLSVAYKDAKLSLGYRADFFFNAIDGGIDARKEENRGFFGPFASISIGLGD